MSKRTTKEIADSIRRGSRLVYQKDAEYKQAGFIAPLNIDKIEYAVSQESVESEDYFLMEIIYDACFVTPEFLYYRIKSGVKRGERGCIEIAKAGLIENLGHLNHRLERLACFGFFFCCEMKTADKAKILRIYYCTMEGFRAFTHRLEHYRSYNRTLIYRPIHEMFRYLATNVVLYAMRENPNFKELWSFERYEYRTAEDRKEHTDIYGRILFQSEEGGPKTYVFVEPVFFSCDDTYVTSEENAERVRERIDVMRGVVESFKEKEDEEAYVLFILENNEGVGYLKKIIFDMELDFFKECCYFTTENAVFESSRAGGDGTDSLLGFNVVEGKFKFKQKNLPGAI